MRAESVGWKVEAEAGEEAGGEAGEEAGGEAGGKREGERKPLFRRPDLLAVIEVQRQAD